MVLHLFSWVRKTIEPVEGIEREIVTKWPLNRSPGVVLVDLWSICQAGAVGNGPGPNIAENRPKTETKIYILAS